MRQSSSNLTFEGDWQSGKQIAQISSESTIELYIEARPVDLKGDFRAQASEMYRTLGEILNERALTPEAMVTEKVFFSDIESQFDELQAIRSEFLSRFSGAAKPGVTYLQQPPAIPGQLCEVQVFIALKSDGTVPPTQTINGFAPHATGKIIDIGDLRSVYLTNITGNPTNDVNEIAEIHDRAERGLEKAGLKYHDVVRTWIYLDDMNPHYDELNQARSAFFRKNLICPAPASTGIQGRVHPSGSIFGLDLRAIGGEGRLKVTTISARSLNEAYDYGSDFARGMTVETRDRKVIYISGTASIDTSGEVVHVGDIRGQVDRMLLNIENLLEGQGASVEDVVVAITYLKEPSYYEPFCEICKKRGFLDRMPNAITVADVCRPDWLCEMEAAAVLFK